MKKQRRKAFSGKFYHICFPMRNLIFPPPASRAAAVSRLLFFLKMCYTVIRSNFAIMSGG